MNYKLTEILKTLFVPMFISIFSLYIIKYIPTNLWVFKRKFNQGTLSIIFGVFIFCLSYLFEKVVIKGKYSYEKAILLGLLAAEVMVFSKHEVMKISTVTLILFFYFHSIEHL
jgi:hypothetical protein